MKDDSRHLKARDADTDANAQLVWEALANYVQTPITYTLFAHCVTELHNSPDRKYHLKFMYPIWGMAKPTFIGGYGSAIISFEWDRSLVFRPTHERYPPPEATFRAEICPENMEISSGRISPLGSVFVGN